MIIGKNSETNEGVKIDLQRLISTRLLIQANSGGGKSWLIRRLLEQSHGQVQQIVLDLEGEFSTLREKYDYLLVGKDGEIPANIQTAELLAKKLLGLNVSTIIDLSELKHHERVLFVKRFLDSLVNAPRNLWHPCLVIVDEAHQFCPEKSKSESGGSVIDLMTRGRKRGFCGVLATQRISKLHKDAAAECNNVLVGRTVLDIDRKRASDDLQFTSKEQSNGLKRLEDGEFFAYGPAISRDEVIRLKIGDVITTHPEPGKSILKSSETPDNIKSLLKDVIDLPKEVNEELKTKQDYLKVINQLKRELRISQVAQVKPLIKVDEKSLERAELRGTKRAEAHYQKEINSLKANYKQMEKKVIDAGKILGKEIRKNIFETAIVNIPHPKAIVKIDSVQKVPISYPSSDHLVTNDDVRLSPAYMRMLKACASFYPKSITKAKISFLSHVPQKASTFRNGLSKLRTMRAIENSGNEMICTDVGNSIAGPVEDIPKDPDRLFSMWTQKLSPAYVRMFGVIFSSYPDSTSKEEISNLSDVPMDASTFRNGLSKLRSLGLIKNEGNGLKMSEDFFE